MSEITESRHRSSVEVVSEFVVTGLELQGEDTIAVLTLEPAEGGDAPEWTPGAHVDVLLENGLERQYSLCGDVGPAKPWRLGVLRDPASRGGSAFIHSQIRLGHTLRLRVPRNNFTLVDAPEYLFIAGGIGITPLIPMIRHVESAGRPWRLVYGGRSLTSLAFVEELSAYGERVTLWPQDTAGIIPVGDLVTRLEPGVIVYCCGPEPLLNAVEIAMGEHGAGALHMERFRPRQDVAGQARTPFDIVLDYSEVELHVPADKSIAEVIEEAGIEVLTSCREGTCGTCETVVLDGVPDHRDSYLSASEKASNEVMMICCSRSKSPRLMLDL